MKPLSKIKIEWSSKFAYVIGLITTDGNLSKDGRHINFTSKDKELADLFVSILKIKNKVAIKSSGSIREKRYYFVQFGDVNFYKFLLGIGLTPKKSKILGTISIPDKYFFDFLRGSFDGDGCSYSYWDPRWRSSFMFYLTFVSASPKHIQWLQEKIFNFLNIKGHITKSENQSCYQLKYAKFESTKLIPRLYNKSKHARLERKYKKVYNALVINKRKNR